MPNNGNNDNNDNIRAGVIFNAGGGAETRFQLTVALGKDRVLKVLLITPQMVYLTWCKWYPFSVRMRNSSECEVIG